MSRPKWADNAFENLRSGLRSAGQNAAEAIGSVFESVAAKPTSRKTAAAAPVKRTGRDRRRTTSRQAAGRNEPASRQGCKGRLVELRDQLGASVEAVFSAIDEIDEEDLRRTAQEVGRFAGTLARDVAKVLDERLDVELPYHLRPAPEPGEPRRAGQSARDQARHERRHGSRRDADCWDRGAHGEERVGRALRRLPEGWRVFHDLQLSDSGWNLDHLVIGPGGVFALNTKNLTGSIFVAGAHISINRFEKDFVFEVEGEARRIRDLLSAGRRRPPFVKPVLVFYEPERLTIKKQPSNVSVLDADDLVGWLREQVEVLEEEDVDVLASAAERLSS